MYGKNITKKVKKLVITMIMIIRVLFFKIFCIESVHDKFVYPKSLICMHLNMSNAKSIRLYRRYYFNIFDNFLSITSNHSYGNRNVFALKLILSKRESIDSVSGRYTTSSARFITVVVVFYVELTSSLITW